MTFFVFSVLPAPDSPLEGDKAKKIDKNETHNNRAKFNHYETANTPVKMRSNTPNLSLSFFRTSIITTIYRQRFYAY